MKTFLLMVQLILLSSLGEILSAKGMQQVGHVSFSPRGLLTAAARAVRNRYLFLSVVCMTGAFFTFLSLLSYADLSYVVPLTAVSYITNTVGAKLLLKERISRGRWTGTLLVAAGVTIISLPASAETAAINLASALFRALVAALNPARDPLSPALPLMGWVAFALRLGLLVCAVASVVYYSISLVAAWSWSRDRRRQRNLGTSFTPPVSIMIPVRGADVEAYENFAAFCRQDYPDYQIVFGVRDADDPAVAVIRRLQADFPARRIDLVISPAEIGHNAKVSNLQNMSARAAHEHVVIVDSDIRVVGDYLRRVVAPLQDSSVGMVTCLYRGTRGRTVAARLENVGITASFGPEVVTARMLEGVKFALGSTIATRRSLLERVGGFHAVADYLADDFLLGNFVAAAGYKVALSDYVVEHVSAPETMQSMLKHQLRWNRAVRVSRPGGYAGLVLTYGTTTSWLLAAALGFSGFAWAMLAAAYGVRLLAAGLIGVVMLGDQGLARDFWMIPLRDWLGFGVWVAAFGGNRIQWRGTTFQILRGGKIKPVAEA